jgi:hypothetical protein
MNLIKDTFFFTFIILVCVSFFEFGTRIIMPISPGAERISLETGKRLNKWFTEPMTSYRLVFAEYDVETNIDKHGNRQTLNNNIGSEDVYLFLGDSTTFGLGVQDKDTVPSIFCMHKNAFCINLGEPGSGLVIQHDKLKKFLENNKLPDNTKLIHMILASTSSRHRGNDILDTINEANRVLAKSQDRKKDNQKSLKLIEIARWLSVNSNAFRVIRTVFGNQIRQIAWKNSHNAFDLKELSIFVAQQAKIRKLLNAYKIEYYPVLLSTYSELANDKRGQTVHDLYSVDSLNMIMGFTKNIDYDLLFFPLDGHATAKGNAHIANNLVKFFSVINIE